MAKAQGTIYAVVRYPKHIGDGTGVYVYSKTTSNKTVMQAYREEIVSKYGEYYNVALVTRTTAEAMKKTWYNAMVKNYGADKSREDKKKSCHGFSRRRWH